MKKLLTFKVNGEEQTIAVDVTETLLDVLRDDLKLTGTNRGCNEGECGACCSLFHVHKMHILENRQILDEQTSTILFSLFTTYLSLIFDSCWSVYPAHYMRFYLLT